MASNIDRVPNKEFIKILEGDPTKDRYIEMAENAAGYLLLVESPGGYPMPYDAMAFSPEEMAQILASCSGRFTERFNAELTRLYQSGGE